jgi:phosphoribosyl 1,2-cyclic phosphodiesterase
MRLILLGVRGSTPAPGAEFVRYGGHTSCVAIAHDDAERPSLVLDAGTGIRQLTPLLGGQSFHGAILVSHLHWDHVQGLPFFQAGDRPDADVDLYVPAQQGRTGRDLLASNMSPPSFPITPEGLQGSWRFHALHEGGLEVEGFEVAASAVRHKGGRTLGFRVNDGAASVAYIPDHVVAGPAEPEVDELVRGVDVLLHDSQFTERERALAEAYGHSTIDESVALAVRCGVRTLVLFHHSPARTDDALDDLAASVTVPAGSSLNVIMATQGMELVLPHRVSSTNLGAHGVHRGSESVDGRAVGL